MIIFLIKYHSKLLFIKYFFFIFSTVAADLYEEVPKRTCYPEKNQKYEMMTQAKMICANDPSCSGLVEAPKRRGQQRKTMYGNYSLTEREYMLCNYPPTTKVTDDTVLFRKRGIKKTSGVFSIF